MSWVDGFSPFQCCHPYFAQVKWNRGLKDISLFGLSLSFFFFFIFFIFLSLSLSFFFFSILCYFLWHSCLCKWKIVKNVFISEGMFWINIISFRHQGQPTKNEKLFLVLFLITLYTLVDTNYLDLIFVHPANEKTNLHSVNRNVNLLICSIHSKICNLSKFNDRHKSNIFSSLIPKNKVFFLSHLTIRLGHKYQIQQFWNTFPSIRKRPIDCKEFKESSDVNLKLKKM